MQILSFFLPLVLALFFIHFGSKIFAKLIYFLSKGLHDFLYKGDNL